MPGRLLSDVGTLISIENIHIMFSTACSLTFSSQILGSLTFSIPPYVFKITCFRCVCSICINSYVIIPEHIGPTTWSDTLLFLKILVTCNGAHKIEYKTEFDYITLMPTPSIMRKLSLVFKCKAPLLTKYLKRRLRGWLCILR